MTTISINGEEFAIDGRPTYPGRTFEGKKVQGLLFNLRAVQATFDDANPATRGNWVYPDTGTWDPDRNTDELCAALESWRDHGVLGFTINFQGGGAIYRPEVYDNYDNSAFTASGDLKPEYASRIRRVIERADELGMVVIAGLFYVKHVRRLAGEDAVSRAATNAVEFLAGTGCRNVLVEIANETSGTFGYDIFEPAQAHRMISALRERTPELLFSTSTVMVFDTPPPSLVEAVDYVLIHGNLCDADRLERCIHETRAVPAFRENPKPLVVNEDSPSPANLEAAWRNYVSWGYFDQGHGSGWPDFVETVAERFHRVLGTSSLPPQGALMRKREDDYGSLSGFQTPPVNWDINTSDKRAFFERVAEITGSG